MADKVYGYPGCPTLSWMIASRVTNPHEEQDAFISFTGRKGSGKSTASIALCEAIAEDIARLRGKGEPPEQFFSIDNIRSITERGAIDLLSSGALKRENSVFLLDDTGTQWGSRSFMTQINKSLNAILQISRVYRCVLCANFIMQNHVDIQARTMTDYRAEMQWKDTTTGQAFFKFFYLEQVAGNEYRKYLTWHGRRIKLWVIEKPSPGLYGEYQKMRHENTDKYIEDAQAKINEKLNPGSRRDGRFRDYSQMPIVIENVGKVTAMLASGKKVEDCVRELGITRYWVQRCQAVAAGKTGAST